MEPRHVKQSILTISLLLLSSFIMACWRGEDKGTVTVTNTSGDKKVDDGTSNRNAAGNSNQAGDTGEAASNEFEGTAGSVSHKNYNGAPVLLREIRTAQQSGFDRVVFEFDGPDVPNYNVEYVDKPVYQCGSGDVVQVAGDGWLAIKFTPANAHTEAGQPTIADRERRLSLPVLKELEITCDFEAEVAIVLGVSSPNRYRVLNLSNPTRVVIDIKHKNK
ncbi:MAG TPA: hypothetical protein VF131_15475 [Blastocatellia bacterium]|nr:hypothetical protein [Blastocatellia bacterium]